jgi:hypothetical protein
MASESSSPQGSSTTTAAVEKGELVDAAVLRAPAAKPQRAEDNRGFALACRDCTPTCDFLDRLRHAFRAWGSERAGHRPSASGMAKAVQFSERHFRRQLRRHGIDTWAMARRLMAENMSGTMAADVRFSGQEVWDPERVRKPRGRRAGQIETEAEDGGRAMNTAICRAVGQRAVVEFRYEGSLRLVEPHCHGVSTAGNEVLRGFQTAGFSRSGNPVAWKLFEVGKMTGLRETGDKFATNRPDYQPSDSVMRHVHCRV